MDLFDLFAKISLDTSDYDKGLDDASGKTHSLGNAIKNGLSAAAKVGAAAIGAATTAATAFAGASVKTGMAFDSSMSQVAATMGKTVEEIAELRDFAQEMGASTAFSATQAADALNFMALAGYDAEQSMAALPNVLNLAAAGGIDLATASDMVTDAQSALGLSMDESAALVDKMAMASSRSNTSVAQLGDAILTIGGTAKTLAGGTSELSTALGILADNGIKGAEGGTALRNIILSLSAPTNTAAKEMRKLGLNVFDAEGNMRPLEKVFGDLNGILSDMTQGEQTQVLSELFNKVDLKSVNALLATDAKRWGELTAAIDNAGGAAQRMADTQLDNLAGDITFFQSALEGAQIVLSDQLTPNLREFVQFGTDGITQIADGFKEGGLSGAMEAFGTVLSDGLNMIIEQLPGFVDAGMQLLGALGEGMIENLPTLLDSAVEIIQTLSSDIIEALPELFTASKEILVMLATYIAENLPELFTASKEILVMLATYIAENLPEMVTTAVDVILQLTEFLIDNVDLLIDAAIEIIMALADGLIDALPALLEKAPIIIDKLITAIANNLPKIIQAGIELLVNLTSGIISAIPQLVAAVPQIINSYINGIKTYYSKIFDIGKDILNKVGDGIKSVISNAWTWGSDMIQGFVDGIMAKAHALLDSVKNIANSIRSFLHFSRPDEGPLRDYETWMPDFMQGLARGINSNAWRVEDAVSGLADIMRVDMDAAFSPQLSVSRVETAAEPRHSAGTAYGDINIYINGAQYSDENALAEVLFEKLQFLVDRRQAALGTA